MADKDRVPGMGVLLKMLCARQGISTGGNEDTVAAHAKALNKVIASAALDPDFNGGDGALALTFTDGGTLHLYDNGRSCCESRYMVAEDDLTAFVGATFLGAEIRDAPEQEDEYGVHEVAFLQVNTSKGPMVLNTHNEHNGYYGGFWFAAQWTDGDTHD